MIIRYFLFCYFSILSIQFCNSATISVVKIDAQNILQKDSLDIAKAEKHLFAADSSFRKARNALISSVLTLGLFYIIALYWLVLALYHSKKANDYYSNYPDSEEAKEAKSLFHKAIGLMILHLFLIVGILALTTGLVNFLQTSTLITPQSVALFAVFLLFICDLLFFNIIFS